jgi:hypothetical protein
MLTLSIPYDCLVDEASIKTFPSASSYEDENRHLHARVILDKRGRFNSDERITTTPILETFTFEGGTLIRTRNSVYVVLGGLS